MATDASGNCSELYWGEIEPREHLIQLYREDDEFLDALEGFVVAGLRGGDGVIVLATSPHLGALEVRLRAGGDDPAGPKYRDRYIAVSAEQSLAQFMIGGWPDAARFEQFVEDMFRRASRGGRPVRAFGGLAAVLRKNGNADAMLRLEQLWRERCDERGLSVFCAYPRSAFVDDQGSIDRICAAHSRMLHR
ncbi:MAG TPA: MEDS domain-containing protein [Tepidisphaeraceae bacterium]|nr:MEDS domain-containing protein [Tepidisphaeraceae bacterium]